MACGGGSLLPWGEQLAWSPLGQCLPESCYNQVLLFFTALSPLGTRADFDRMGLFVVILLSGGSSVIRLLVSAPSFADRLLMGSWWMSSTMHGYLTEFSLDGPPSLTTVFWSRFRWRTFCSWMGAGMLLCCTSVLARSLLRPFSRCRFIVPFRKTVLSFDPVSVATLCPCLPTRRSLTTPPRTSADFAS